ncbi:MAG: T9SS type A sorting domain-containing protein [Paludibacteraceae bacterium]|nr:T9SS type A sorting domain-containing protein [Paludibacteraceae bacterium]
MKRLLGIVLCLALALPMVAQEETLCLDGTLLFREDFGGNDLSDPEVISDAGAARVAVLGMSSTYFPCLSRTSGMSSGKFLVTKQGYQNGIQWHIMDDHTYPNDKTKGYLLQIDGKGDNEPFYTTTIEGLCPGSRLTFSAYVANVMTWGHYMNPNRHDIYPRMKFVLTDPSLGTELATYDTGDIPFDSAFIGDNSCWQYSAHWQLIGMNFTVPDNTNQVKLTIYNNVSSNGSGNDFVLDDIEIRLCAPPVTIEGESEVCTNTATSLTANFSNDGTFVEPLEYKWWHSTDSITWSEMSGFNGEILTFNAVQKTDSGWYRVAVSGEGNIENVNCRMMSEPFRLRVNECAENLCIDGTLLFREDFGGNDPSDPRVGQDPVPGMTYTQATNDVFRSMGSGKYIVTKSGYCNGDTTGWSLPGADQSTYRSQWYIQDDHTYPNDYSRGYFMEIDGSGGNQQFYQTEISGLCEGIELTFSAYVANVFTWFQYDWYTRNRGPVIAPCLKFVLTNPQTGETLVEKSTQQIPFAEDLAVKTDWQYSSPWYLVGMNFIVPTGIPAIRLTIYNNVTNGNGNDFALDDIEIRLCAPPVMIEGEPEVCTNTPFTLTADFTNDGTFAEPLAYKWWHSTDSITWSELSGFNGEILTFNAVQKTDSGWYRVAVSGEGNIENVNCRAVSEPFRLRVNECAENLCIDGTLLFKEDFGGNAPSDPAVSSQNVPGMSSQYYNSGNNLGSGHYTIRKEGWSNGIQWHRQDDHTYPDDKTRGYLLEVDGMGGTEPFYSTTIDGLCAGSKLTFSAYVVNVHYAGQLDYFGGSYVYPRMKFVLKDPTTGAVLAEKSTGDIQPDWRYGTPETWKYARENKLSAEWQLIGMNFVVPDGIESIQMFIYNDVERNGSGNDFALDDIEIHLCAPPVSISGEAEVCENTATTLTANFTNDGTFAEPLEYKWWHSTDSITWSEMSGFNGEILTFNAVQRTDSGWYKVAVSGAGNIESVNCRTISEPFLLNVQECEPPYYIVEQTLSACHEDSVLFRDRKYAAPGFYSDTVLATNAIDTIYHLTVTDNRSFKDVSLSIMFGSLIPPIGVITESGVYKFTFTNAAGCDSIVTWYVTVTERCIESQEENQTFCAGTAFEWHGRLLDEEGDYRDTLWHQQNEACDTAVLLHLRVLPTYRDTTFAAITYGEEYIWEGKVWTETTTQTHRHTAANTCDSLTTLQLIVDYSLTVEQMDLESGCSENEQMTLHLQLSRPVDSVRITFSDDAKRAGLRDSIVYFHAKQGDIFIPHRRVHPGRFTCEVALVHGTAVLYTTSFAFTLLYPASVLEQAWNDVVAVLTRNYNGGYDFIAFQWYENGEPLTGETHSYLYKPLIIGGEYSAMLTEPDGTKAMTCPLIAMHQEDISLYPTVVEPRRMLRCYVSEEAELILYDALGRVVARHSLPPGETHILAPGATGVYIACIVTRSDPKERPYKLIVR